MIENPYANDRPPALDPLVKLKDAARFLRMSERSVGQKARDGIIPSAKIGGARRFSIARLREWVEDEMRHSQHDCGSERLKAILRQSRDDI